MHLGVSIEKNNTLLVGVDVGMQKWSEFRTVNNQSGNLVDAMTLSAGMEYTPKVSSTRYWDVVTYRLGFQYNQLPYQIAGTQLNDINGSAGISLPVGAFRVNYITLSVVGGQRGALIGTQIREQYVRMALGFSLNDRWFRKQVID
jgi:hypothetical protein